MSKRQKVTFKDLTEKERLTLCAVAEAIGRKDKRVNIYISKKTVDVSVAPWSEERTGHWETVEYEVQRGETETRYRCSECGRECGRLQHAMSNYCPGCGARMEVDTNE